MTGVRVDKWLWAARFFKTRSLAAEACGLGRIECNGQPTKASREVRVGDPLQVKNEAGVFQLEVVLLSELRGPAAVAQTLYVETETSKELRLKAAEERNAMRGFDGFQEAVHRNAIAAYLTAFEAECDYTSKRSPRFGQKTSSL